MTNAPKQPMDELFKELMSKACNEGKASLSNASRNLDSLVAACRLYPEYLYEHSAFALASLRKHLDGQQRASLAANGVYMDYKGLSGIIKGQPRIYFIGDTVTDLYPSDYAVATLYLFNKSDVTIHPGAHNILVVETYDHTRLHIAGSGNARITVHKYDCSVVTGPARIKPEKRPCNIR
ncbi:MAG: hypothetical protein DBY00_04380 [Flavobacteriales bacterium]|nr:MAG: hypothetical protein DBY00_04380 [Flavobacteriales bacterium]